MKVTHSLVKVAVALMEDPVSRRWGYELWQKSGVRSGVLYPTLQRMLDEGWLVDGWEDPSNISEKRPPRRYYRLTERGISELGGIAAATGAKARGEQGREVRWV